MLTDVVQSASGTTAVDNVENLTQTRATDSRAAPRTSIYLAAVLYCDGFPLSVRIRNLSETGALLDGAVIPNPGALVQLIRGELIVHGLVAWSSEGRFGLKFSGGIDVKRWQAATSNSEQQRVDEVVRLVKAGAVPLRVGSLSESSLETAAACPELACDLKRVAQLLDELGEELAGNPDTVERHGLALQSLDISVQLLTAIEALISENPAPADAPVKLEGLRRSADQALRRHPSAFDRSIAAY